MQEGGAENAGVENTRVAAVGGECMDGKYRSTYKMGS